MLMRSAPLLPFCDEWMFLDSVGEMSQGGVVFWHVSDRKIRVF